MYVFKIIWITYHSVGLSWAVEIGNEFKPEFFALHEDVLRFSVADGEWRVAFAFDTKRKAILLVRTGYRDSAKSDSTAS
jgi:hypothetical protein